MIESSTEYIKIFDFSIQDMIDSIMLELNDEIIELNQVEQLSEGIDAKGQKIKTISAEEQNAGNVYGFQSIQERQAKGLQTDNVDLKITGTLWNSFKVVKVKSGWQVNVNWKVHGSDVRDHFDDKYEFDGLMPDNLDYLVHQELMPRLEKRIRTKLKI